MKNDPYFKYLAPVIIAGVLVALFDPTPLPATQPDSPAVALATQPVVAVAPLSVPAEKTLALKKHHRAGRRMMRAPRQS